MLFLSFQINKIKINNTTKIIKKNKIDKIVQMSTRKYCNFRWTTNSMSTRNTQPTKDFKINGYDVYRRDEIMSTQVGEY